MPNCSICGLNKPLKRRSPGRFYSWCEDCNRKKKQEYQEAWEANNPGVSKKTQVSYRNRNRDKCIKSTNNSNRKLRLQMIEAYGGACSCCGEKNFEFLTLEHKDQRGGEHRRRVGGGWKVYRELRDLGWPKDNYTVLCMNCNWATRLGIICPHKRSNAA